MGVDQKMKRIKSIGYILLGISFNTLKIRVLEVSWWGEMGKGGPCNNQSSSYELSPR